MLDLGALSDLARSLSPMPSGNEPSKFSTARTRSEPFNPFESLVSILLVVKRSSTNADHFDSLSGR